MNFSFAPAIRRPHILVDRQRVEKFIGDDDRRDIARQVADIVVMDGGGQPRRLCRAERRAGFDQMDALRSGAETRHRAQRVDREGAAAGPEFDIANRKLARAPPHHRETDAAPLADTLAELGRGTGWDKAGQYVYNSGAT